MTELKRLECKNRRLHLFIFFQWCIWNLITLRVDLNNRTRSENGYLLYTGIRFASFFLFNILQKIRVQTCLFSCWDISQTLHSYFKSFICKDIKSLDRMLSRPKLWITLWIRTRRKFILAHSSNKLRHTGAVVLLTGWMLTPSVFGLLTGILSGPTWGGGWWRYKIQSAASSHSKYNKPFLNTTRRRSNYFEIESTGNVLLYTL